jgi:hypothetical protein
MLENFDRQKSKRDDIRFQGTREDKLMPKSANEFYELVANWEDFENPMEQLNRWCQHYYGEKFIPINFALKLWEKENYRDELWPFVQEEFLRFRDDLDQHSVSTETIKDIHKRLDNL